MHCESNLRYDQLFFRQVAVTDRECDGRYIPWRKGNVNKNYLCYSSVYYCNGAQRYEQFLTVGRLHRALNLLSLTLFRATLCLWSSWCYIYINFFWFTSLHLLVSWTWWNWPLTWLTNHHPSVLWRCWLGHLTSKIVSEMTYNVSSGTVDRGWARWGIWCQFGVVVVTSRTFFSKNIPKFLLRCSFLMTLATQTRSRWHQ